MCYQYLRNLLLIPIVLSCKVKEEIIYVGGPHVVSRKAKNSPIIQKFHGTSCTQERALEDLGRTKVWLQKNGKNKLYEIDLTGVSGKGLSNKYVTEVIAGHISTTRHIDCRALAGSKRNYKCEDFDTETNREGNPVLICEKKAYPVDSIENTALAATVSIFETAKYQEEVLGNTFSKVEVLVLPVFRETIESEQKKFSWYNLDNAYWSTQSRFGKIIV